jgi:hypothetical protein
MKVDIGSVEPDENGGRFQPLGNRTPPSLASKNATLGRLMMPGIISCDASVGEFRPGKVGCAKPESVT